MSSWQAASGQFKRTTPARAVATRCIWNAVLFAAMNCAMVSGCAFDCQYRCQSF